MPHTSSRRVPGVKLFFVLLIGSTVFSGVNGQTTATAGPPDISGPEVVTKSAYKDRQVQMECRARGDPPVIRFDWFVGHGRAQPVQTEGNPDYSLVEDLTGSSPTSTLTILSMKDTLADEYACWATNAEGQKDMKRFNVELSSGPEPLVSTKDAAIAGGVVGALVFMTIFAVIVFFLWKRKQPRNRTDADGNNYEFHEL